MTNSLTRDEIMIGLRQDISECLSKELDEVTPEATFFNDLEGESIDLLDVSFRCEKRFGARIQIQSLMSGLQIDSSGRLSETGIRDLESKIPEINWAARAAAMTGDDPRDLLTVDLIAELVRHAIFVQSKN